VRGEFGFRGYVVTDEGALNNAVTYHKYYRSVVEAAAAGANAGVNLELPDSSPAYLHLTQAVQRGLVKKDTLLDLVKPLFYTRMRLGEFDPPTSNPYSSIDVSVIESRYHRELAVFAATKTFVLLKNEAATLPFTSKLHRLAVSKSPPSLFGVCVSSSYIFSIHLHLSNDRQTLHCSADASYKNKKVSKSFLKTASVD